jgi:hypothetical protein
LVQVARDALAAGQNFEQRTQLLAEKGEVFADAVKASAQVAFLKQGVSAAELEARMSNHDLASFWTVKVDDPLDVVDILDEAIPPHLIRQNQPAHPSWPVRSSTFLKPSAAASRS